MFVLVLIGTLAGLALWAFLAQRLARVSLPLPLEIRLAYDHRLAGLALASCCSARRPPRSRRPCS